ncbi:reverse transcriptase domain-containing protein [Tanacetum coccineum]|uniref:Reverse transcriptase domain-containing protein n=1 Tax=Tanacetum coccineum TaxID=301880 RepID=A0ABQ5FML5_9ASTR
MSQPANDDFSQHLSDDEASYHEDASENGTATNKPKQQQQQLIPTTTTISNIKLPILKKEEYDIWAMEMEHYLEYIDNDVWKVIQNGNSKKRISTGKDGVVRILPPVSAVEIHAVEKERKARTILLMAIPKEHLRRFHGNEGLGKGRVTDFQTNLLSQLKAHGAEVSTEDANYKFLRSLPPAWSNLAITMRTRPDVDTLSIDDLYNNLRVFEQELTSTSKPYASAQNVAFVSHSKSSTNKVKSGNTGAYTAYTPSTSSNNIPKISIECDSMNEEVYKGKLEGESPGLMEINCWVLDKKKLDCFELRIRKFVTMNDGGVNWGETLQIGRNRDNIHARMAISSNYEVWICQISQENSQKRTRERMSDQEAKEIKAEAREIMPQAFYSQLQLNHSRGSIFRIGMAAETPRVFRAKVHAVGTPSQVAISWTKNASRRFSIIESKSTFVTQEVVANDSRVEYGCSSFNSSYSNNSFSFDMQQIAASLEDKMTIKMNKMLNEMKALVVTTPAPVKAVEEVCVTCGSNHNFNHCPLTRNGNDFPVFHDNIQQFQQTAAVGNFLQRNQPSNLASQMRPPGFMQNYHNNSTASTSRSGTLPSQSVTNPREHVNAITTRSGKTYEGLSTPLVPTPDVSIPSKEPEQNPVMSTEKVQNSNLENSAQVPPLEEEESIFMEIQKTKAKKTVKVEIQDLNSPRPNSYPSKLPYPERMKVRENDKPSAQQSHFLKMFKQLRLEIGLNDALVEMPKVNKWLSSLLRNKEKLEEIAITTVNAECSAIIMNKVPEKLEDPGKFLIPCALQELNRTSALADSGASINLLPHSIYKKLGLEALTPTRMTLELANRSITHPMGIAEDVVVRVDGFTFLADFVVVNFEPDPRVPIILGRPFLRTAKALIDLYEETLTLRVGKEELTIRLSGSTTSTLPPSSSSVKTSDNLEKFANELAPLDSLPPENDKDAEIKFYSSFTLTSPKNSEFEAYLERDSIPQGIDLTLPPTLEV